MTGRVVRLLERAPRHLADCEYIALQAEKDDHPEPPVSTTVHGVGKGVVAVLPYDPLADVLVLVEQLRPGAWVVAEAEAPGASSGWTLEVVAGHIDHGCVPQMAARMELKEEISSAAIELIEIRSYLPDPVNCGTRVWQYCGLIDATTVPDHGGAIGEGEVLRVHRFSGERLTALLSDPSAANAATIICLQWLALQRALLRERARERHGADASSR